jgi:hypothetical protein
MEQQLRNLAALTLNGRTTVAITPKLDMASNG